MKTLNKEQKEYLLDTFFEGCIYKVFEASKDYILTQKISIKPMSNGWAEVYMNSKLYSTINTLRFADEFEALMK